MWPLFCYFAPAVSNLRRKPNQKTWPNSSLFETITFFFLQKKYKMCLADYFSHIKNKPTNADFVIFSSVFNFKL